MTRQTNFSRTGILNIVLQVLYLVVLYLVADTTPSIGNELSAFLIRAAIVLIPSLLWVMFFYLQDRVEPEPTRYVIAAFVVGMALAKVFVLPVFQHVFATELWMRDSMTLLSVGSLSIIGLVVSSAFYVVLRYGFYPSREFDEPVDGMVYGAFIGAGYAAVESMQYLSSHTDYTLFAMGYTASSNVVVYASIGSIVGYFVGKGKFADHVSLKYSFAGLFWGMFLLGSYTIMKEFIFLSGFENALWVSFTLSIVFAALILGFVFMKMRKLTAQDLHQDKEVSFRLEIPLLALIVMIMFGGYMVKQYATKDITYANLKYGLSFQYPHWFTPQPLRSRTSVRPVSLVSSPQMIFTAVGTRGSNLNFTVSARNGKADLASLNISDYVGTMEKISLTAEPVTIQGKAGTRLKYSYIDRNRSSFENIPDVQTAFADIIPLEKQTLVFMFSANSYVFGKEYHEYEKLLSTVQWTAE